MQNQQEKTILVVDDQKGWRKLVVSILQKNGYIVTTADNFEKAKALLQSEQFDLAVIDMRLIDADSYNIQGMEILKERKAHYPEMKTVILTGYPDEKQKKKALEYYGAAAYLEKVPGGNPLDVDEFSRTIVAILNS